MLKIYNTATKQKDIFIPMNDNKVLMYNCGPTVYDYPHIGNLRAFLMADILRRSLEYLGYEVKQVMNYTDVGHLTSDEDDGEDKLEKGSKRTGKTVWEVAQYYINAAELDFVKMNFLKPFKRPRATEEIVDQVEMVQVLLNKGIAYDTKEAVYFDITKYENYGELSGQKLSDKKIGAREDIKIGDNKRNSQDFRLWQYCIEEYENHTMRWGNTWNDREGFPGWHIECSAMAHKYLGDTIDIHTGGIDHIPVHHENEIAQSVCTFDKKFVNYWYHCEFLSVDGKKMSKSLGNFYTLEDIEKKGFEPMDLRYFYLTADFRQVQNFTWEALQSARNSRLKILDFIKNQITIRYTQTPNYDDILYKLSPEYLSYLGNIQSTFRDCLDDSFNMPKAISLIFEVMNSKFKEYSSIINFDKVFGLGFGEYEQKIKYQVLNNMDIELPTEIIKLAEERLVAKKEKRFVDADRLKKELQDLGWDIRDNFKDYTLFKIN